MEKKIYYFIYETTNLVNGKKYRGMHKTEKIEDGYLGSGLAIEKAIIKYGKENFVREILEFTESYDELIQLEKIYVDEDWVLDESNYNLKTGGQSSGILSDESKKKISNTLKEKYKNGEIILNRVSGLRLSEETKQKISNSIIEKYKNETHPNLGRDPWNKGKKGSQIGWCLGMKLGPQTEESNRKRSETLKERWKHQEHPSKGVEPWNKGKKGVQTAWNKGKKMKKVKCKYCDKEMDLLNLNKYHNEKCKLKTK